MFMFKHIFKTFASGTRSSLNTESNINPISKSITMAKKYKIVFDRDNCIGALACVSVADKFWEDSKDGKVNLKGAKKNAKGEYEIIIDAANFNVLRESADVCPVNVIKIYDTDTGELVFPK